MCLHIGCCSFINSLLLSAALCNIMANLKVRVETLGGGDCAGIDRDAAARLLQQTFTDALYLAGLINCLPCLSPDQVRVEVVARG